MVKTKKCLPFFQYKTAFYNDSPVIAFVTSAWDLYVANVLPPHLTIRSPLPTAPAIKSINYKLCFLRSSSGCSRGTENLDRERSRLPVLEEPCCQRKGLQREPGEPFIQNQIISLISWLSCWSQLLLGLFPKCNLKAILHQESLKSALFVQEQNIIYLVWFGAVNFHIAIFTRVPEF